MIHSNGPHSIVSFKCRKLSVKVRAWGFSPFNGFLQLPPTLRLQLANFGEIREGGREEREGGGEGERGCLKSSPHLGAKRVPSFS